MTLSLHVKVLGTEAAPFGASFEVSLVTADHEHKDSTSEGVTIRRKEVHRVSQPCFFLFNCYTFHLCPGQPACLPVQDSNSRLYIKVFHDEAQQQGIQIVNSFNSGLLMQF